MNYGTSDHRRTAFLTDICSEASCSAFYSVFYRLLHKLNDEMDLVNEVCSSCNLRQGRCDLYRSADNLAFYNDD
ncbi:hypothetical protein Aduo_002338 [Ancylostoma duodenale]